MQKIIAALCLFSLLAGCGDSAESDARALIGEAKTIYDTRTMGAPGKIAGTFVLGKPEVNTCIEQMDSAQAKLATVARDFASTKAAQAVETRMLSSAVTSQRATCKQIKIAQGW